MRCGAPWNVYESFNNIDKVYGVMPPQLFSRRYEVPSDSSYPSLTDLLPQVSVLLPKFVFKKGLDDFEDLKSLLR